MASNGHIKPHAVVLPYPLQGHITPLIQLSKLLAARGFDVSFVSSDFNIRKLLSSKQALMATHLKNLGIRLVGISDGLPDTRSDDCCLVDPVAFLMSLDCLHASFDELVGKMVREQAAHISCIISDSFLLWSQDVADKWGIPRVCFWPQSLTTFACSISLPRIKASAPDLDPFKEEVYKKGAPMLLDCIPGLSSIDASKLPFLTLGGEMSMEWMRIQITSQMACMNAPLCVLCNTFPPLEEEVHKHLTELLPSPPFLTLGPLLPAAFDIGQDGLKENGTGSSLYDEDEECIQWLDMQSPQSVLYISLGSVAILEDRDVHEIALGLEACQVPFLWVVRSLACGLVSTLQKGKGKIIRWAPQLRVLAHPAVGGFLTHCGWNSVLESACMGVPIIGWPQMIDQITNCWLQVEMLGVGLRLEVDGSNMVGQASVEKAARILMQEEEGRVMRVRALEVSTLAKSALTTSLTSNLDSLIQIIVSSQTKSASSQS